jgi:hypothetical protein
MFVRGEHRDESREKQIIAADLNSGGLLALLERHFSSRRLRSFLHFYSSSSGLKYDFMPHDSATVLARRK